MRRSLAFLSAGLLVGCGHVGASRPAVPAPVPREGFVTTDDGVRLRYKVLGSGPEAVVVANTGAWLEGDFAPLANGRTVVFFDARNRGGSDRVEDPTRIGLNREAQDIDLVRQHLRLDRIGLIGWSYVGALVALYARDYPQHVTRIVQVGAMAPQAATMAKGRGRGAGIDSAGVRRIAELRKNELDKRDPVAFCREQVRWTELPPRMGDWAAISRTRMDPCKYANEWPDRLGPTAAPLFRSFQGWDWRESMRAVQVPALVIHGTEDFAPIEGGEEWARTLANARIVRVHGAGHLPWLEEPELVFGAIDRFLRGEWPEEAVRIDVQ